MAGFSLVDGDFAARSTAAVADAPLVRAVRHGTEQMSRARLVALDRLADPDAVRDAARAARTRTLSGLRDHLAAWADAFEARGGRVCWATDAAQARAYILDVVRGAGARRVVKGKSMATEEIELNAALEADGVEVMETDLGEFIIQLAGEPPSHIIAPALHKNRFDVAELLSADAGTPVGPEISDEVAYARRRLRESFLRADVGITGVNFAVASAGAVTLVENEGNGRLCTSLPRVHIAVMGMERVVADWAELDLMLALLARSASGQDLSVYTNILSGPRQPGEVDGPEEMHVVVLDNGRSSVLGGQFQEALACIRCGACLNTCPVYRQVGGHAYGSVYAGPIGAVITPLLHESQPRARELAEASSLCGACHDVCPVRIPLHDLLVRLRERDAPRDASWPRRAGFRVWSALWSTGVGYRASTGLVRLALRLGARMPGRVVARLATVAPGWLGGWLGGRRPPGSPGPGLRARLRRRSFMEESR
jgi:L-lactate dehydrogenase complex protein LldF